MAIDGLHASLIYVDELKPSTTRARDTKLQGMVRWEAILDFRIEIERYWESLINITRTQDLPSLETLFTSFSTPTYFMKLLLSYVASICSRRTGKPDIDNIFRDINIWRDSIGDPQHHQLFNDLIQRLWEDMTAPSFQTEQFLHSASPSNGQDYMAPQSATMHDISVFSDVSDPFWGGLFDVPGSLPGPNFQMTGTTKGTYPTVFDPPSLQPSTGDLRQSAVMNILTSFLANCGDLMDILSGHGATTKGPHSDVSKEVKNFARALRRHESFEEPSARGILAIVDRFVGLDYFQSIEEIRDYIIIVAKEILPSCKPFAEVCKSIYLSTDMTKMRPVGQRQHADRAQDRKLKHANPIMAK
ncbi:hypothetical protein FOC1_g10000225 [Fusarium oxysporum f. sp. cubense race 1]|uniref:Uncharacterized protein n=1 Tax=Fusarium oxysporum f. sp. cubense (strain race 1) TaxID=1229664 RepID=N4U0I6_FUSC1|nr:hypothetical protein FOC1_g10000225 [Fusarium oxysporum f. sp. cubense race 1]